MSEGMSRRRRFGRRIALAAGLFLGAWICMGVHDSAGAENAREAMAANAGNRTEDWLNSQAVAKRRAIRLMAFGGFLLLAGGGALTGLVAVVGLAYDGSAKEQSPSGGAAS